MSLLQKHYQLRFSITDLSRQQLLAVIFLGIAVALTPLAVSAVEIQVTNGSFEDPALGDGQIWFDQVPGWTSIAPGGAGTENHASNIYGGAQASDGFNVYWNNFDSSDPSATGALLSDPVGTLNAGTYTLTTDFLFRTDSFSADSMPDTEFGISIDGTTILGTPTLVTDALDSSGNGLISTQSYSFTVPAASPMIGQSFQILYNASLNNLGSFNQLALDNVTIDGPFEVPLLTINRRTGEMILTQTGGPTLNVTGYQIDSRIGAFDQSQLTSISGNFDATPANGGTTGDGSFDADDNWTVLVGPNPDNNLSEFSFDTTPGNGGSLATGTQVNLGTPWVRTPLADTLTATLALADGTTRKAEISFVGDSILTGDFTQDGQLTVADWQLYISNAQSDLSGLSLVEAYLAGDLNGDGLNNIVDTGLFIEAFEDVNGGGSFAAMLNAVPEPGSLTLCGLLLAGMLVMRKRTALTMAACLAIGFGLLVTDVAYAAPIPVTNGSFENPVLNNGQISFAAPLGWAGGGGVENHNRENIFGGVSASNGQNVYWNNLGFSTAATASLISDVVGVLSAGTYTLQTDFLFRTDSISADSMPDTQFGLTIDGENFLGTPTTVTDALDVSGQGLVSTQSYSFTVPGGSAEVGEEYQILYKASHNQLGTWNQLALDNVRLDSTGVNIPLVLTLEVDTITGMVSITNNTAAPVAFNSYEIRSLSSGTLAPDTWLSLDEQNIDIVNSGLNTGESWDEAGTTTVDVLHEGFLLGSTSLSVGQSVSLGEAFNENILGVGIEGDLEFLYRAVSGDLVNGQVVYTTSGLPGDFDNSGSVNGADFLFWQRSIGTPQSLANWQANYGAGSGAVSTVQNVPEPSSFTLYLMGGLMAAGTRFMRSRKAAPGTQTAALRLASLLAVLMTTGVANAEVYNDRVYLFGDDTDEGASANIIVGSGAGNVAPGQTLDSGPTLGLSPTFLDLTVSGNPTYANVANLGTGRTGLGARFDGDGDLLTGIPLNRPDELATISATYPLNYDGITARGLQGWVYPDATALGSTGVPTTYQSIVFDTIFAGGPAIDSEGRWTQSHSGQVDGTGAPAVPATVGVPQGDTWYHVMQHAYVGNSGPGVVPGSGGNVGQTSVLYVDGIAVSATNGGVFTGGAEGYIGQLVVGAAEVAGDGQVASYDHFFTGAVDDLDLYVYGDNTASGGRNYGTFDLFADNEWIANEIATTVPGGVLVDGDANKDGTVNQADVNQFISGWLSQKTFVGNLSTVRAGDWLTWETGDFNHDGITDIFDAVLLHQALLNSGNAGLNFSLLGTAVPEPSSSALVLLSLSVFCSRRHPRLRGRCH